MKFVSPVPQTPSNTTPIVYHFELIYFIVKLYVAIFNTTENASMGTYFVSL